MKLAACLNSDLLTNGINDNKPYKGTMPAIFLAWLDAFFSQRVCSERGVAAAPLLTRPVSVTNDEIICDTPPRASAGLASLALALNVYDAVGATCDDKLHNGDEAGVDCGGASCAPCAPSCYDGVQNGEETGVDCGGGHATADGYTHCPYCIPACDARERGEEAVLAVGPRDAAHRPRRGIPEGGRAHHVHEAGARPRR